ncbi:MAG TPA: tetratricopeptide repeat protein [Bacteroidia bacterium]|jgi:serine phosphatase RsbU (regulator of sigma subunit)/tetratricopeptide (TPR) repeat protein|nr:tetratricopeptide repeat protein [Bacteroidia bacterium]
MKKLVILFLLFPLVSSAQEHQRIADSLQKVISRMPDDTNKVKIMLKLCEQQSYFNEESERTTAQKGLELATRIRNNRGIGAFNNLLGRYYENSGDYNKAISYYLEAEKWNRAASNKRGQAISLMNAGNVFYYLGNFADAKKYHREALDLNFGISNDKGIADSYMNLGNDFAELGRKDSSMFYYLASLRIREQIHDDYGIAQTLSNLGETALDSGKNEDAKDYLLRARNIKTSLQDTFGLASTFLELAEYYRRMNDHKRCLAYADSSIQFCFVSKNSGTRKEVYHMLAAFYEESGDIRNALKYHKMFSDLKDSIFREESSNSIAKMKTVYESDKKDRENQVLIQQNRITTLESGKKDDEIKQQKIVIISAIAGLVLVLLLAGFIYKGLRDRKRAHEIIVLQKEEVEHQKELLDEKQKEILDSITYAKRIQGALLASESLLQKNLPEHFVFYKPKDIVSGDFYWATALPNGKFLLLTGDCTGHGVPGAFMSLLNITLLNKIVNEHRISQPNDVLNEVRRDIIHAFDSGTGEKKSRDGMDCNLVSFDMKNRKIVFSCAMNPILIVRKGQVMEFPADKQPVGYTDEWKDFTLQQATLEDGDMVYSFTDGFADQFGGEKGKKYKYSRMKEFFCTISSSPATEQREKLENEFNDWKKDNFQVDDVLIIGVRV